MKKVEIVKDFYKKTGLKGLANIAKAYNSDDDERFVKKYAKKEDKILDLACGYGRVSIPLARAGFNITGIDLARNLIIEAKKKSKKLNLKVKFDVGDMTSLPYKDNSFDKIFCLWNSFNEILLAKDQIRALNESYRVLKQGGKAFFILISVNKKQKKLVGKDHLLKSEFNGVKTFQYIHGKDTLNKLLTKSHFKVATIKFVNMNGKKRLGVFLQKIPSSS